MADPLFVFAYDISQDRVRRRVAGLLEAEAVRVQGSVFEARLSKSRAKALGQRIAIELERGDTLRVYCLSQRDLKSSFQWGGAPMAEAQDFYIL
ncbi:CRISPR-associated endonuclease Cas2 [Woodsholea maritima]|uniref:CRISPR-associated endonuclease Cas2 n=1 Tax=Woodsholea maritima TaxID=240237 RepID=UPI00035C8497|nr:CRISPR-associated endonuclease Cas2 [Woodsholea maritima]